MKKNEPRKRQTDISDEIRKFLINALKKKGWHFFDNPTLCKCWEEMDCSNDKCPSYKSSNLRCWQVAGTFCEGKPQGDFAKKFGDCHKCRVFKKATEGDISLQIGEDFNNLMFQLKNKEDELKLHVRETDKKNRELLALNKKINRLIKRLDTKNKRLRDLAIRDDLTGLFNYRYFRRILQEQFKMSRRYKFPLSCIMIDIDYFKAVNDTYGHQFGDAILKQLADILKNNVRDTDKVVRYGGEEFAILFPYTDYDSAFKKSEKLRKLVKTSSFIVKGDAATITISLGIASYPATKKITRAERLVSYADEALYKAKEEGRNQTALYTDVNLPKEKTRAKKNVALSVKEKRRGPRVKTLIKATGEMNKQDLCVINTVDLGFSGVRVVSEKQVDCNKILKITLYLPDLDKETRRSRKMVLDGLAVWCERVDDQKSGSDGSRQKIKENYLVGIQFSNVSKEDSKYLQRYFVMLFKMEGK
ncbi:MAG: diguanylate cyclase [Nitrospirota bacterium]